MEYRIEKIKDTSKDFEGIRGMKVLTYISYITNEKRIDGPIDIKDYDKYYEWLRKETNEYCISFSNDLEQFKREFISDPGEFIPIVFEKDVMEDIEVATLKDIIEYNSNFNNYFENAKEEVECS
ncbi:MAG: hypothetical protein RR657_02590 [Peptostreptococcaceae bacterium]